MTATTPSKITSDDLSARARAQQLLLRIADHGEQILNTVADPLDIPDYLLGALVQAGMGLVTLAELDAHAPAAVELLLDGTGDLWVLTGDDRFECQTAHCDPMSLGQIQSEFGVRRQFVAGPPADR